MRKKPRKKRSYFHQSTCAVFSILNQDAKSRVRPRNGILAWTDIIAIISIHSPTSSIDSQSRARNEGSSAAALVATGSLTPAPFSTALSGELDQGILAFQITRNLSGRRSLGIAAPGMNLKGIVGGCFHAVDIQSLSISSSTLVLNTSQCSYIESDGGTN